MSYWKTLPPTDNQLKVIDEYNCLYGVKINIKNKQDAHDVIAAYCIVQKLDFDDNYVKHTQVSYEVAEEKKFNSYKFINNNRLKNVTNIEIKDGIANITMRRQGNNIDLLAGLNNLAGRLTTEVSCSEYEDSLGYLNEQGLELEKDLYGPDPIWWDK